MTTSESFAFFGQLDYDISDRLELTLGLRYDEDDQSTVNRLNPGPTAASAGFDMLQPKVQLSWHWAHPYMAYATYSEGFRSGGFTQNELFDNEETRNYELGFKGTFADGKLVANASVFHVDYVNQQLSFVIFDQGVAQRGVLNLSDTDINGFELELMARPIGNLRLDLESATSTRRSRRRIRRRWPRSALRLRWVGIVRRWFPNSPSMPGPLTSSPSAVGSISCSTLIFAGAETTTSIHSARFARPPGTSSIRAFESSRIRGASASGVGTWVTPDMPPTSPSAPRTGIGFRINPARTGWRPRIGLAASSCSSPGGFAFLQFRESGGRSCWPRTRAVRCSMCDRLPPWRCPKDSDLFPDWLARSKVSPIVQHVDILSRPSLTARLNNALDSCLTLVHAPAGYGKSTVLADWCKTLPNSGVEEIAWLALEGDDNDPFQLVLYLAYSLSVAACPLPPATSTENRCSQPVRPAFPERRSYRGRAPPAQVV